MLSDRRFDELVRQHHGAVAAFARALCADRSMAEDAVQETYLRAWRYLNSYRSNGSFEGWLLAICRNCVIDLAQRREFTSVDEEPEGLTDPDHSAELFDLMARLPLPQREVLVLCGWLGYDYADAALLIGVPVGTVRSRLHRARERFAVLVRDDQRDVG